MTTFFVMNGQYGSYIFVGSQEEIQMAMEEAYSTMPGFRKTLDMDRYERFRAGLGKVRRFVKRFLVLEDKL